MKRKIEITFELEETVFYKVRKSRTGFCRQCRQTVETWLVEEAAVFFGFSRFQIFRLLEAGGIHFVAAESDCICRNSIENLPVDNCL